MTVVSRVRITVCRGGEESKQVLSGIILFMVKGSTRPICGIVLLVVRGRSIFCVI